MRGNLDNYQAQKLEYNGFYRGVVVDNADADKMGKCRVRVVGVHSPDLTSSNSVPIDTLPWAEQAAPIFGEGVSAGGAFSVPAIGSHVFVFFEGGNPQRPIYFAYMFGIPSETYSTQRAFPQLADPQKVQDKKSDFMNSDDKSSYDNRKENVKKGVDIGNTTWDEPDPGKPSDYGDNVYLSSPSGVGLEMGTKPKAQRLVLHHPSGSFTEYHTKGDVVKKSAQDLYDIVSCKRKEYTAGDMMSSTDGSRVEFTKKDQLLTIKGKDKQAISKDQKVEIGEFRKITVGQYDSLDVTGYQNIMIKGAQTNTIMGLQLNKITGSQTTTVGGAVKNTYSGLKMEYVKGVTTYYHLGAYNMNNSGLTNIFSYGAMGITCNGALSVLGSVAVTINAPFIFLN